MISNSYELYLVVRQAPYAGGTSQVMGIYGTAEEAAEDLSVRNTSDVATSGLYESFCVLRNKAIPCCNTLPLKPDDYSALSTSIEGLASLEFQEGSGYAKHQHAQWNLVTPIDASGLQMRIVWMSEVNASGFNRLEIELKTLSPNTHASGLVHEAFVFDSENKQYYEKHINYHIISIPYALNLYDPFIIKVTRLDDEDTLQGGVFINTINFKYLPV